MDKYIAIIELPYGKKDYLKSFDKETKEIETTSLIQNAILINEEEKSKVRYNIRKTFPSYSFKLVKLAKYNGFFTPITSKIDEIFPNHQYDYGSMLNWKNNNDEPSLVAKEIAKSNAISDLKTFDEFAEYVANAIGEKHNLKKEGEA